MYIYIYSYMIQGGNPRGCEEFIVKESQYFGFNDPSSGL